MGSGTYCSGDPEVNKSACLEGLSPVEGQTRRQNINRVIRLGEAAGKGPTEDTAAARPSGGGPREPHSGSHMVSGGKGGQG